MSPLAPKKPTHTLVKITVLAAFEVKTLSQLDAQSLGDAAADLLRAHGALAAATHFTTTPAATNLTGVPDSAAIVALYEQFPRDENALFIGALPPIKLLGQNGLIRHARLTRTGGTLELWLGHTTERFPLLVFTPEGSTGRR